MPSWEHIKQTERPDLQKTYSAPKRTCFESLYTEPTMGNFQKTIDNTILVYKIVVDFSASMVKRKSHRSSKASFLVRI